MAGTVAIPIGALTANTPDLYILVMAGRDTRTNTVRPFPSNVFRISTAI